jgi:hypothetical protein
MKARTTTNNGRSLRAAKRARAFAPPVRCPLTWWRTMRAEAHDDSTSALMREALSTIAIIGEPRWRQAMTGDAAAAIGLVMSMTPRHCGHLKFDLSATALAICAINGSAAACLVMANVLRKMPDSGPAEARLATSWLTVAFRPILDRKVDSVRIGEKS